MKQGRYENLSISDNYQEYEFTSVGPKGVILKIIQFTPTQNPLIVNLAFGNKKEDGSIDDLTRNDNKDRNKILVTVFSALTIFFQTYPDKWVFFAGSTPERTRLYRMAITLNYDELEAEFEILGVLRDRNRYLDAPFKKGTDYFGFLIKKKKF